jgi:hypothetical protein
MAGLMHKALAPGGKERLKRIVGYWTVRSDITNRPFRDGSVKRQNFTFLMPWRRSGRMISALGPTIGTHSSRILASANPGFLEFRRISSVKFTNYEIVKRGYCK